MPKEKTVQDEIKELAEETKTAYEAKIAALKTEQEAAIKAATDNKVEKSVVEALEAKHKEDLDKLEGILRRQGEIITQLGSKGQGVPEGPKTLEMQLKEFMVPGKGADGEDTPFERFLKKEGRPELILKAAGTMLQATNIEPNGNNFLPVPTIQPGVHSIARNKPVWLENMNVSTTDTPHVAWLNEYNPQGDAAWTAEGNAAPLESFEIQVEDQVTQEVIGKFKVSEKMLKSIAFIKGEIENKGLIRLKLDIDAALSGGNGTAPNIKGIQTYAPAFTVTSLNGTVISPNLFDVIGAMRTQIKLISDQWEPTAVFINTADAFILKHAKATTEEYLMLQMEINTKGTLDGMTVVETNQISQGYVFVGDMTKANVKIWENIKMEWGWENDDFTKRLRTIILYADLLLYVSGNEIGAFVYDTIANVKTAIAA